MDQLSSAAFALSLVGGIHDLFTRRIPNWLTLPAILCGCAAQVWYSGLPGLFDSLLGVALGFLLFFPIYATGNMGAGDVKLQMAVGAWLGWWLNLHVAIGAVLLGGAFALIEVASRGRFFIVAQNIYSFLRGVLVPGLEIEKLQYDAKRKFAFGICIAGSVALVIFLRNSGRLS